MNSSKLRFALVGVASIAAATLFATPATAGTGCNGVINILEWGCAPWDNNNGPQFKYWKKQEVNAPVSQVKIVDVKGQRMAEYKGKTWVIAPGAGNVIAPGAGNVIAPGAGNMTIKLIGHAAGN